MTLPRVVGALLPLSLFPRPVPCCTIRRPLAFHPLTHLRFCHIAPSAPAWQSRQSIFGGSAADASLSTGSPVPAAGMAADGLKSTACVGHGIHHGQQGQQDRQGVEGQGQCEGSQSSMVGKPRRKLSQTLTQVCDDVKQQHGAQQQQQQQQTEQQQGKQFSYERLQLQPEPQLPPRVEHVLVETEGAAAETVARALNLPVLYVRDLIEFGAVYYSLVIPQPPPNVPDDVGQRYREFIVAAEALLQSQKLAEATVEEATDLRVEEGLPGGVRGMKGDEGARQGRRKQRKKKGVRKDAGAASGGSGSSSSSSDKELQRQGNAFGLNTALADPRMTLQEKQKVRRVTSADMHIPAGAYMRVHVHPRRFPRCYAVNWHKRIIAQTDDFVVVDKPAGVPVGGTVDNLLESCASFGARAINLKEPLRLTHQLDTCTQGCVVFAKTKAFAATFNQLLSERRVRKLYRVLSYGRAPSVGVHVHHMLPSRFPPRIVGPYELPGWQRCELHVVNSRRLYLPHLETASAYADVAIDDWLEAGCPPLYESVIQLITGRTHQIRAQFSFMRSPLVGDSMYASANAVRAVHAFSDHLWRMQTYEEAHKHERRPPAHEPTRKDTTDDVQESMAQSTAGLLETASPASIPSKVLGGTAGSYALDFESKLDVLRHLFGPGPDNAIGLQAFHVEWNGQSFQAGTPWWRVKGTEL